MPHYGKSLYWGIKMRKFHTELFRLLGETIKVANDEEWLTHLGEQYEKQYELYNGEGELKVRKQDNKINYVAGGF